MLSQAGAASQIRSGNRLFRTDYLKPVVKEFLMVIKRPLSHSLKHKILRRHNPQYDRWLKSSQKNVALLPIPKNANTWLTSIFLVNHAPSSGFDPMHETPSSFLRKQPSMSPRVSSFNEIMEDATQKLIVLRDPKKRLVSGFYDKLVKKHQKNPKYSEEVAAEAEKETGSITFLDFLSFLSKVPKYRLNFHFLPQYFWVDYYGEDFFNKIGTLEDIEDIEAYLKNEGFDISLGGATNLHSGIQKKTNYASEVIDCTKATIEDLSRLTYPPHYLSFFGESECRLFEAMYQRDVEIHKKYFCPEST
ncbi:sulfotransferase family 2 domain-containing protein [Halorhodospira halophila]|uniref:sulfotransferase family 2 domain-containing protein n=1 Tax=Halorhodospira halophila TaxID=1053 RepID=UPI001650C399|nr:sulfotransferase family 2 domain-containing protein [Halorhodospira halophila]